MKYGYQKITNINFENVNEKLRKSLMEVGFGIITEIDVQSTFKEKLGIDYVVECKYAGMDCDNENDSNKYSGLATKIDDLQFAIGCRNLMLTIKHPGKFHLLLMPL